MPKHFKMSWGTGEAKGESLSWKIEKHPPSPIKTSKQYIIDFYFIKQIKISLINLFLFFDWNTMSCSSPSGSEEDDEGIDSYRKGGYHAVRVGDQFSGGRYIAQRKLGWGQFSIVWLAYDTRSSVCLDLFLFLFSFLLKFKSYDIFKFNEKLINYWSVKLTGSSLINYSYCTFSFNEEMFNYWSSIGNDSYRNFLFWWRNV